MKTIYIVQGSYEDRGNSTEWIVGACADKAIAHAKVEQLNKAMEQRTV